MPKITYDEIAKNAANIAENMGATLDKTKKYSEPKSLLMDALAAIANTGGSGGGGSSATLMHVNITADMTGLHADKTYSEISEHMAGDGIVWLHYNRAYSDGRINLTLQPVGSYAGSMLFTAAFPDNNAMHLDMIAINSDDTLSEEYI